MILYSGIRKNRESFKMVNVNNSRITKEEFLKRVKDNILPILKEKDYIRLKLKRKSKLNIWLLILSVGCAACLGFLDKIGLQTHWGWFLFVMISLMIFFVQDKKIKAAVRAEKKDIFMQCLKWMDLYPENEKIDSAFVKKSKLFSLANIDLEDGFSGRCMHSNFYVSELHFIENKWKKHELFHKGKTPVLLLSIPYLNVKSQTMVYHTSLLKKPFTFGFKKIVLPQMGGWNEKNIVVSKDKKEAEFLLTPSFLKKLAEAQELYRQIALTLFKGFFVAIDQDPNLLPRIDLSFFDGQLFLAIHLDVNVFELFDLSLSSDDLKPFEDFYFSIEKILESVAILEN